MPKNCGWLVALALSAALAGGCSSIYAKGTPFYSGPAVSKGTVADSERVQVWPLVYRRDASLSVLWPLFETTDDHYGIRPFWSVYNLDRGGDEREYNVLWPLSQFDFRYNEHRVFPCFWGGASGDRYFVLFPEVWWFRGGKCVFPFFWGGSSGDRYFVLFPEFWWFKDAYGVFPFFWGGAEGSRYAAAFPLFWYGQGRYCHFFPLWLHEEGNTSLLWPVVNWRDDHESKGWRVWPLCGDYGKNDHRYAFALWPLGHYWRDGDERWAVGAPFYWQHDVDKATGWRLALPVYYGDWGANRSTHVTPLWSCGRDGELSWSLLFPAYYHRRGPGDSSFLVTLLGGMSRNGQDRTWIVPPALTVLGRSGGEKDLWTLAGLAHARWGGGKVQNHLLPLYYYDREDQLFLSPLFSRRGGEGRDAFWNALLIGANYSQEGGHDTLRLIWPLTAFAREAGYGRASVYPVFSTERFGDRRETWVFPWFWSENRPGGRENSLFPLWSWKSGTGRAPDYGGDPHMRPRSEDGAGAQPSGYWRDFRILGWLYEDHRRNIGSTDPKGEGEAVRARVLWKIVDYQRAGRDKSLDCFPFIAWDSRESGARRFAFAWRLFRWESTPDGGRKLDVLFVPLRRKAGEPKAEPAAPEPAPRPSPAAGGAGA